MQDQPEGSTVGIIFPVPIEHAKRLLEGKKDVLVKYISRVPRKPQNFRLKKGMKVLFYISGSGRRIAGEAEIHLVGFLPPLEAFRKYQGRMMLSRQELLRYATSQPKRTITKPLLVLELDKIQRYGNAAVFPRNVSMAGEYLSRDVYDRLPFRSDGLRD